MVKLRGSGVIYSTRSLGAVLPCVELYAKRSLDKVIKMGAFPRSWLWERGSQCNMLDVEREQMSDQIGPNLGSDIGRSRQCKQHDTANHGSGTSWRNTDHIMHDQPQICHSLSSLVSMLR